jgi:hypothetical protein
MYYIRIGFDDQPVQPVQIGLAKLLRAMSLTIRHLRLRATVRGEAGPASCHHGAARGVFVPSRRPTESAEGPFTVSDRRARQPATGYRPSGIRGPHGTIRSPGSSAGRTGAA